MTMENTFTEPMPGHYAAGTFSANTRRSERHLALGVNTTKTTCKGKAATCRERDR